MLRIGCHLSAAKGYLAMGREAVSLGANTFQFFSRNPRGGAVRAFDLDDVTAYNEFARENDLDCIIAHAPYTVNPCSPKEELREFAIRVLREDLERLRHIPGAMYNLHPGSHVKQGTERGIDLIVYALNEALSEQTTTPVLLETMAGKGSEIGRSFDELRQILDRVETDTEMGVCLDTCHVFDAGYDVRDHLDNVLEEFDRVLGLKTLRAVHLNDSKNVLGSRKDRHEQIGEGNIGLDAFRIIISHQALRGLPFYLETPHEKMSGYAREIALLRGMYEQSADDGA